MKRRVSTAKRIVAVAFGIIEAGIGKALTQRANDYSYLFGLSYRGCGEEA